MNSLPQKIPRSFVEHNDEWTQSSITPGSNLLRWDKKGSNLIATSAPNSLYCDISTEQEEPAGSSPSGFGFSSEPCQNREYGSSVRGLNDLRSPRDMLVRLLGQDLQHSHQAADIRNYLSSAYLNPRLKSGMRSFAPYNRK